MSIITRQPAGTPVGGQFAPTSNAAPGAGVGLAGVAIPDYAIAQVPTEDEMSDLSAAAAAAFRAADATYDQASELQLAGVAVDAYRDHDVVGFTLTIVGGSDGELVVVDSVTTANGQTLDEGEAFDAVEEAVFNMAPSTDLLADEDGSRTFDSAELIASAPELAEAVRQRTAPPAPLRAHDLKALASVVDLTTDEAKIHWQDTTGRVVTGTVRTGTWTAEGTVHDYDDFRDAHLRITAPAGVDIFRPVSWFTENLRDGLLARA